MRHLERQAHQMYLEALEFIKAKRERDEEKRKGLLTEEQFLEAIKILNEE